MSTVPLKRRTPFALRMPSTPSGMRDEGVPPPLRCVGRGVSSEVSVIRTRPAVLIASIRAGTRRWLKAKQSAGFCLREEEEENGGLTRRAELQTSPMKLLLCAMRTASLIDMEPCPLLGIRDSVEAWSRLAPRSLHSTTGSVRGQLANIKPVSFRWCFHVQFGCFQFNAVQISALKEVRTIDLIKSGDCSFVCRA